MENHWLNENTMLRYIENIIVPYVERVREEFELDEQAAISDSFKGHLTEKVTCALEEHNAQSVVVPGGCRDRLQPLDLAVNKSAKSFLRSQFQKWY